MAQTTSPGNPANERAVLKQSTARMLQSSGRLLEVGNGRITLQHPDGSIITIPEIVQSVQGLEFFGLTKDAAKQAFDRYRSINPQEYARKYGNFFSWAEADIKSRPDGPDWEQSIKNLGMTEFHVYNVMGPEFDGIRKSTTAKAWVIHSMWMDYERLVRMEEDLLEAF